MSPPQRSANAQGSADTGDTKGGSNRSTSETPAQEQAAAEVSGAERSQRANPPEPHSGLRLAKRYRLEECITRLDGFSSWRAVDEKLRRAVGVHLLPASHERAARVLSAARSTALLADPRFVQVLDAVEENGRVHIVHEWLPDATPLSTVLASSPLEPYEAHALVSQVSEALAAAHREGLSHLRLTPGTVLRTGPSQFRIRGLAVEAALRGISADTPQRTDTEAMGALLYACLTQRWPYSEGAYGLDGVAGLSRGSRDSLATPEQVRAGVHRGLSDLAMRALVNNGATATSHDLPCTTPEELCQAVAAMPRIHPPEPESGSIAGYQRTTYQQGTYGPHRPPGPASVTAPPTLPGRTGAALKWGVAALLIAALALGSWQLADALVSGDNTVESTPPEETAAPEAPVNESTGQPVAISRAYDFDPFGADGRESPNAVGNALDGDPETFWHTQNYFGPGFANTKSGVGLILDLGEPQQISALQVEALGDTGVDMLVTPADVTSLPTSFDSFRKIASGSGESLALEAEEPVQTQYVLVWLTDIPRGSDGNYRGRITNVAITS